MIGLGFDDALASAQRVLAMASAEKRIEVFHQLSREYVRFFTVGEVPKPDVIDALRNLGLGAALTEVEIQEVLTTAVEHPFDSSKHREAATRAAAVRDQTPTLIFRRASDIEPEAITWLWPARLAIGKVTIIAGEPGLGKSQLSCALAATVTTGGQWPCGEGISPRGSVIILSAEDDAADTIRPRLDAAGADVTKVLIVSAVQAADTKGRRSFNLQSDLLALERTISGAGDVVAVLIDPVSSYLGKVDSHKNAELRAVLEPLGEMAARLRVAVVAITHLNKSGSGSANNRFIGSIAFVAAARAAFIVARDNEDKERRLFLPTKNNVGREGNGLSFRIGLKDIGSGIFAPMVLWEGAVTVTAEEALASKAENQRSAPDRENAESFLKTILEHGPLPTRRIQAEAKEAGLAWATVRRAKDMLGVIASKKALDGSWTWELPPV